MIKVILSCTEGIAALFNTSEMSFLGLRIRSGMSDLFHQRQPDLNFDNMIVETKVVEANENGEEIVLGIVLTADERLKDSEKWRLSALRKSLFKPLIGWKGITHTGLYRIQNGHSYAIY